MCCDLPECNIRINHGTAIATDDGVRIWAIAVAVSRVTVVGSSAPTVIKQKYNIRLQ